MPETYGEYYQDRGRRGGVSGQGGQGAHGDHGQSRRENTSQGGRRGAISGQGGQGSQTYQGRPGLCLSCRFPFARFLQVRCT
jgi:hypothetical protein